MNVSAYEIYQSGERIITKDKPATKAYMIVNGKVRVFLEQEGRQITLGTLGENDIFGETSIFAGQKYGAHVEAIEDGTKLYAITQHEFNEILKSSDPIVRALIRMLIDRLKHTNAALLKSETREFMEIALI